MVEEHKSKLTFLHIYPNCPFYKPVPLLLHAILVAIGTVGISFLNFWVAVGYLIYSILWYLLIMPTMHCKYCYFKTRETTSDNNTGKTIEKLLPKEQWVDSCLQKHVECGKKFGFNFFISFFLPIILVIISFFLSFSVFAIIALIGFIGMLAATLGYVRYIVCPTCPIKDECHAAF
ncbi:MAG: hypothetical protein GY870_14630 [archaeon]|nr:hypothetical protein [archaeon]